MSLASILSSPSRDAACSSGPSPTRPTKKSVHLIGPGRVGRAVLRELADLPVKLVAVSDSSATVFAREGLDAHALAGWKESGRRLSEHELSAGVPLEVALDVFAADLVIDCSDSCLEPAACERSRERARALLRNGRTLLLAAKTPLLGAGIGCAGDSRDDLLAAIEAGRLGVNAVFGGAGRAVARELASLRADATGLACVANATTTALVSALERGRSFDDGCAWARALGLLERDPAQDLDGRDAALKLALIASLWLGRRFEPDAVVRRGEEADARALDPATLRERRARGATTRLVGRATRDGALSLAYEEVAAGSALAVPSSHVSYSFALPGGATRVSTRVFLGDGLGPQKTARALVTDLAAHLGSAARRVAA